MKALSITIGTLALAALAGCGGPEPSKTANANAAAAPAPCPERIPNAHDDDLAHIAGVSGKPVERVCLLGAGESRADLMKAIRTKEGDKLDPVRIREDLSAMMAKKTIDDIAVYAEPRGQSVALLYEVRERPRIADVRFDGAKVFSEQGLADKVPLEKRHPLVLSEVKQLELALREEYIHRGYGGAKIEHTIDPAGPGQVSIHFKVTEGPQWKLSKVSFKGAKTPEAELVKLSGLETGKPFDVTSMEPATMKVLGRYYDRGYLMVRVEPNITPPDASGNVTALFTIEEGDVYRIGALKFAKLGEAAEKDLRPLMKTKPNQVFDRTQIKGDVDRIGDYFKGKGKLVFVNPVTDLDTKKKKVDILFEILEGQAGNAPAPATSSPAPAPAAPSAPTAPGSKK